MFVKLKCVLPNLLLLPFQNRNCSITSVDFPEHKIHAALKYSPKLFLECVFP